MSDPAAACPQTQESLVKCGLKLGNKHGYCGFVLDEHETNAVKAARESKNVQPAVPNSTLDSLVKKMETVLERLDAMDLVTTASSFSKSSVLDDPTKKRPLWSKIAVGNGYDPELRRHIQKVLADSGVKKAITQWQAVGGVVQVKVSSKEPLLGVMQRLTQQGIPCTTISGKPHQVLQDASNLDWDDELSSSSSLRH